MTLDIAVAKRESQIERARKERARDVAIKKGRKLKRVEEEVATIDHGREFWRRYEQTPQTTQPTPERAAKATEIGSKVIGGKSVRTVKSTADQLVDRRHLPRHLRGALDTFCSAVAEAMGAAVNDGQGSTSKLISNYDGMASAGTFGPREIPDRVLRARFLWKTVEREMPPELLPILEQLVAEEIGLLQGRPVSLQHYGNGIAFNQEKQAGAAGSALAIAVCAVLHHAIKRGIGQIDKPRVHAI